jgi:hypothetical protein
MRYIGGRFMAGSDLVDIRARLARVETDVRDLQYAIITKFVGGWLSDSNRLFAELRRDIDSVMAALGGGGGGSEPPPPPPPKTKRHHNKHRRTWKEWRDVNDLIAGGMSVHATAKHLGIPYTTVYTYKGLSQDKVDALLLQHEARERCDAAFAPRERTLTAPEQ